MDKKKILIITQRFFPAPSPRSYRATELAKEMARQGHDVTVYAVLGNFNYSSFEKEFNLKIRNIGKPCFAILNSDNYVRHTFLDRALRKILNSIVEFPDIELTFKMFRILKVEKNVDLLITVTNPHPINWGCALTKHINKRIFPKIWIADCGDPYMGNAIRKHPPYFYFKYIEKGFCRMADFISVPFEGAIDAYYPEFHEKIKVIPQGFEFDQSNYNNEPPKNLIPTFAYAGTFIKGYRDPTMFLEYLATIHVQFKFIIFTSDISLIEPFIEKLKGKPVYLTIDLDVLDPSVFPGTGTPEAGGVSFMELLNAMLTVSGLNIVACDVNELSPIYDQSGVSTAVACKVLRELLLAI